MDHPTPELSAELVRERSYLFRTYVPLAHPDLTEWFDQPDEGRLIHVEWDREVAVLTYMVTRYPTEDGAE